MTDLAVTASKLLAKYGEPVTLTDGIGGAAEFDPVTGDPIIPAPAVAITANGYPSRYNSKDVDGQNIQQNDVRLILEAVTPKPERGWAVTVAGVTYRIENVQDIRRSGDTKVLICQLRAN